MKAIKEQKSFREQLAFEEKPSLVEGSRKAGIFTQKNSVKSL